jgi:hypothetical protein
MGNSQMYGSIIDELWEISVPESEPDQSHYFTKEEVKNIISETVRERLYKEYDRLTAKFDRRHK